MSNTFIRFPCDAAIEFLVKWTHVYTNVLWATIERALWKTALCFLAYIKKWLRGINIEIYTHTIQFILSFFLSFFQIWFCHLIYIWVSIFRLFLLTKMNFALWIWIGFWKLYPNWPQKSLETHVHWFVGSHYINTVE